MTQQDRDRQDTPLSGSTGDRLEGTFDEAKGRTKSAAGELTGDERLQGEGQADQLAGKAKQGLADAKEAVGDAAEKLKER